MSAPSAPLGGPLARVAGSHPAAVLLVDLDTGQVVYVNELAEQLAPGVVLPTPVDEWSRAAGLWDSSGSELDTTDVPLRRVAAGEPVRGELVTARRGSDVSSAREDLWVIGTPLTDAPEPLARRALVLFFPLRDRSGIAQAQQAGMDLRHRAVLASDLSFSISDPTTSDDELMWVNPAFERATGFTAEQVLGRNCRFLQGPLTDPAAVARIRTGLRGGGVVSETLLNYRADGTAFWNHLVISPIYDQHGTLTHHVGVQSDVTDKVEADAEREAALQLAEQANRRLTNLAAISRSLTHRLADAGDLFAALPQAIAAYVEGWVAVLELDRGTISNTYLAPGLSAGATNAQADSVAAAATAVNELLLGAGRHVLTAAATSAADGTKWPILLQVAAEQGAAFSAAAGVRAGAGVSGQPHTVAVSVLRARGQVMGLLLLIQPGRYQFGDPADQAAIVDLADRASIALDNARLYLREHRAALTLQRSLLPQLPAIDGLDLAAAYLPSQTNAEIGGDWYDVLELPDGSVAVTVGDVMGHDLAAAAAMGQLRSMVRTLAYGQHPPAQLLMSLDTLVQGLHATQLASVFYASITTSPSVAESDRGATDQSANVTRRLTYASAGHLPGLLRHPDGHVEVLDAALTSPIGVSDTRPIPEASTAFPAGACLVLYTDGLIERRDRTLDTGIDALVHLLTHAPTDLNAHQLCDLITATLSSPNHTDDTCVLVICSPAT